MFTEAETNFIYVAKLAGVIDYLEANRAPPEMAPFEVYPLWRETPTDRLRAQLQVEQIAFTISVMVEENPNLFGIVEQAFADLAEEDWRLGGHFNRFKQVWEASQ